MEFDEDPSSDPCPDADDEDALGRDFDLLGTDSWEGRKNLEVSCRVVECRTGGRKDRDEVSGVVGTKGVSEKFSDV
jgi:hypothetical protein